LQGEGGSERLTSRLQSLTVADHSLTPTHRGVATESKAAMIETLRLLTRVIKKGKRKSAKLSKYLLTKMMVIEDANHPALRPTTET
jgi:hypothetical protein